MISDHQWKDQSKDVRKPLFALILYVGLEFIRANSAVI